MKRYAILLLAVFALLIGIMPSLAHEHAAEPYLVSFSDEAITLPEEVYAGLVNFTFENTKTEMPVVIDLGRLNEDVTPESFLETMMSAEDPFAALALVTLYGGTEIYPSSSVEISYHLEAGSYVLIDFAGEPSFFEVLESDHAEATEEATAEATEGAEEAAHVEVELADFAVIAPDSIPAGENLWHISNTGEQWHEMAVYRITDEALTTEEVAAFLLESATAEEEMTLEGLEPVTVWLPMDAGTEAWVNWDLEAGSYVLTCFLPDMASEDMHSHIELGMIRFITVVSE